MATIRKRGKRWQAQVRRKGAPPLSKSFVLKSDAAEWCRATEAAIDRGELRRSLDASCQTVGDLIRRYRDTVSIRKRGHEVERIVLDAFLKQHFSNLPIRSISAAILSVYRDERLKTVRPSTVNRQLGLLHHVFEIGRSEWGLPIPTNPLDDVRRPKVGNGRDRRLQPGEETRLLESAARCRNQYMVPLIELALATAMRRGELLNIHPEHIDFDRRLLLIPVTKNGHPRTIPLSQTAVARLRVLSGEGGEPVLPMTPNAVRLSWQRLTARAGIEDLHFHDLRHEAISRFFELRLSVPEVALISGHRDPRQLFRYTHLRPEDIAEKL